MGLYGTPADFYILSVSLMLCYYYCFFSFLAPLCILLGACDLDLALNCLVLGIPADCLPSLAPEWPPRVAIGAVLPVATCWIWLFILAIWFYSLFLIVYVILYHKYIKCSENSSVSILKPAHRSIDYSPPSSFICYYNKFNSKSTIFDSLLFPN